MTHMYIPILAVFIFSLQGFYPLARAQESAPKAAQVQTADLQARSLKNQKLIKSLAEGDILGAKVYLTKGALPLGEDRKGRNALHLAAAIKDTKILNRLLDSNRYKLPLNAVDHIGQSPVFEAVESGHLPSVQLLVEKGARLDLRTRAFGDTLLHRAAQIGQAPIIEFLAAQGLDVNVQDLEGNTPLHAALKYRGDNHGLKSLLRLGAHIDAKNTSGQTPLLLAAQLGNLEALKYLIQKGANLQALDNNKQNALQLAIQKSQANAVAALVHTGAYKKSLQKALNLSRFYVTSLQDILQPPAPKKQKKPTQNTPPLPVAMVKALSAQNSTSKTLPLHAWTYGQALYVQKILEAVNLKPNKAYTGYQSVLEYLSPPTEDKKPTTQMVDVIPSLTKINTLMKPDFNLESKNLAGHTPLLWSCLVGRWNSAQVLIQAGADTKVTNKVTGQTFLHLVASQRVELDRLLWFVNKALEQGLSLNAPDKYGLTPLHYAAANGQTDTLDLLLKKTQLRQTKIVPAHPLASPLALAAAQGHLDTVKYLHLVQKRNSSTANVKTANADSQPLVLAAAHGHYKIVDYLLRKKASPGAINAALDQATQSLGQAKKTLPYSINKYNSYKIIIEFLQKFKKDAQIKSDKKTKI